MGLRFTIDGSPPQDYYVLLSYRLEGVDQNCRIPVVRIASQTGIYAIMLQVNPTLS